MFPGYIRPAARSAHATVLPASNMRFSGDYAGHWAEALEQATGGPALFFAGGVGSHGPSAETPGVEGARRMGEALARLSVRGSANLALTNHVSFGLVGIETGLPPLQVRVSLALFCFGTYLLLGIPPPRRMLRVAS